MNSPAAVYQIEPAALALLRRFDTNEWHDNLTAYLAKRQTLAARYARERKQERDDEAEGETHLKSSCCSRCLSESRDHAASPSPCETTRVLPRSHPGEP